MSADARAMLRAFEDMRSDYRMAQVNRFRERKSGISALGSHADYHYRSESDFLRLIEYARDVDRNNVVVGQAVWRLVANVLQEGFRVDPRTGDAGLDDELMGRWKAWSHDPSACHLAGEWTFPEIAEQVLHDVIVDGDSFVLPLDTGEVQVVEAHRVRTPKGTKKNVVHGILLDDFRRRLEYWVTREDVDPSRAVQLVREMRQIPARDEDGQPQVLHVYDPKRASQTRGVTTLAPMFDAAEMHDDIQFAKLVQQKMVSAFAIIREFPEGAEIPDDYDLGDDGRERATSTRADGGLFRERGFTPGMEVSGDPGEKITGFSPAVPNAEFFEHASLILTFIAINLQMPLQMLLLDAKATNFSGWRGAFDQAKIGFRRLQRWLVRRLHERVYRWKVRQFLAEDPALRRASLAEGVDVFAHRWHAPNWAYIEPLKDASADLLRMRNGLVSPSALFAERGVDWQDHIAQTIQDNTLAIRAAKAAALEVNEEFDDGAPVHWRECLNLPTPDGVTVQASAPAPAAEEPAPMGDSEDEDERARLRLA